MKQAVKIIALSLIASALAGGSGASAAALSTDGLRGSDNRLLLQVTTEAGSGDMGNLNGARLQANFRLPNGLTAGPDGSVYVADTRNHEIRKLSDGRVSTAAGIYYQKDGKGMPIGGLLDGKSDMSLLSQPTGLAADAAGNVYVADTGNHAIRRIDPSGQVTTIAGDGIMGSKDGQGAQARFQGPRDVAVAADGTIYVADTLNHLIRSISPAGAVKTLNAASDRYVEVSKGQAAPAGDYADGALASAKFNEPSGLALDAQGNLYVSDTGNQRIRYIDLVQGTVSTVAGIGQAERLTELYVPGGYADGAAATVAFNFPLGLAVTEEGGLVVADSQNHSIRYVLDGQVTTLAGTPGQWTGELDGIEAYAEFQRPSDVAVLPDGGILVADSYNNKIRLLQPYRLPASITADGSVKVVLDQRQIAFDAMPEIDNGRTMVPVRAITEALGYEVKFDDDTRAVRLAKAGVTIELYVDRTGVKRIQDGVEGQLKETDTAPYIKQDRTYVPIRFFAEEIGLDVQWDNVTRTAILRSPTTIAAP
ncbi:Glucose/arabinose dehydrogenase, beta-propeller fold [Paenibacillus sp. UNCCL117]|uniref:stalk domain-containing protein n=1 Tax=unclassified Paenibacillus TaxID=185978 RepID=UPI00088163AA|nr:MULTISPECIES: stalk domain-containing protein [unclassified Paenibacillus]SDC22924.1 Glucose/arabinose dehydrogenase, beta-propeller fold [Paenibacillus sp. cl123]SFW19163.1 Glucose/arabinose dehydrogenase, beta-propeller fold [Paenibacillus sp. UNCCL117]